MQNSRKMTRRANKADIPKRLVYRPEIRYYDTTQALTNVTTTASTLVLTDMPTGDAARTRDGPVINLLRTSIRLQAKGANGAPCGRIILARLLYDEATLAVTDALENASPISMYNRDFVAPRREGNRMDILADWCFAMGGQAATSSAWNTHLVKDWEINLSNLDKPFVRFLESNATNVPIFGGLVLFFISDVVNGFTAAVQARVEFLDS